MPPCLVGARAALNGCRPGHSARCLRNPVLASAARSALLTVKASWETADVSEDVELKKSQREILESKDEAVHKKHDADLLKGLEKDLPMTGLTTEKQDYAIMYEVTEIMRDLAGNPNLDPDRVNKYMLKKMGLSAKTIDEIMKLKHIYEEVEDGKK